MVRSSIVRPLYDIWLLGIGIIKGFENGGFNAKRTLVVKTRRSKVTQLVQAWLHRTLGVAIAATLAPVVLLYSAILFHHDGSKGGGDS